MNKNIGLGIFALAVLVYGGNGYLEAHKSAAAQLEPLREEFVEVVDRVDPQMDQWCYGSLSTPCSLYYGGRLEEIVDRRNAWLKEHDCAVFGGWYVRLPYVEQGTMLDTRDVFYWCPFKGG